MSLKSAQFDDIYFSPEDGLAESRFVFLEGNGLPAGWDGRSRFVIAESGFGTGLNFLAAWELFERTAKSGQTLHYISFEKYPLAREEIATALERWAEVLGGRLEKMLARYPVRIPGFHRVDLGQRIQLTLVFDDINGALPQLDVPCGVDAWFLDGFAPAKNPDMWTDRVFSEMARLSKQGTSFATFTAAGFVRRGLEGAGFAVEKKPGFGRKRERLTGRFAQNGIQPEAANAKRIAVIGGRLSGLATAYVLKRRGLEPVVFEKNTDLGQAGWSKDVGLYNPRLSAYRTPEADFYMSGWAQAVRTLGALQEMQDIRFSPCGSLQLVTDETKEKRLHSALENWCWHSDHMRWLDPAATSAEAGIDLACSALYLPDAGAVSPGGLCRAYAGDIEVRAGEAVLDLEIEGFDAVVLACAAGARELPKLDWLPLHTVRGQITQIAETPITADLKTNLCFGGYMAPAVEGVHTIGATFQKWLTDTALREEDDRDNIERVRAILPNPGAMRVTGGRAGLRTSSMDRFPLIGKVPDYKAWQEGGDSDLPDIYLNLGHGSHGIVSSIAGAHLVADMITGGPHSLGRHVVSSLYAGRFPERSRRKREL